MDIFGDNKFVKFTKESELFEVEILFETLTENFDDYLQKKEIKQSIEVCSNIITNINEGGAIESLNLERKKKSKKNNFFSRKNKRDKTS